eukprot:12891192-Prorocentrum_lima.AAC.1
MTTANTSRSVLTESLAGRAASSNFNPNGVVVNPSPDAAKTVDIAPVAASPTAPMQTWEEDRDNATEEWD